MIYFLRTKWAKKTNQVAIKTGKKNKKHHVIGRLAPDVVMFSVFFSGSYCDLVCFFSPFRFFRELTSLSTGGS